MKIRSFISGCEGTQLSPAETAFFHGQNPWGLILFKRNCATPTQIAALTVIGFLPETAPQACITVPVAFLGAVQIGLFRTVGDLTYMPAATTGNLMRFVQQVYDALTHRGTDPWRAARIYGALISSFAGGAVAGAFSTHSWGVRASWVAAALAALMLVMLVVDPPKEAD